MSKDWIQSLSNKQLFPRHLESEQVGPIREIAHALAGNFRFTRQTEQHYSVAEHCVRGSRLLPAAFAGAFLLHELSEVYLPDINSPTKPFVFIETLERRAMHTHEQFVENLTPYEADKHPIGELSLRVLPGESPEDAARAFLGLRSWSDFEREHTRVILAALGLSSIEPLIYSVEVKRMDLAMLAAEKRDLCGPAPEDWNLPVPACLENERIVPWSSDVAEVAFTTRFHELFA